MKELYVPDGTVIVDDCEYIAEDCERVVLPPSVKCIKPSAFSGSKCREVVLPEGLEEIGEWAFMDCPLQRIVLPRSLKVLGSMAFMDCRALERVEFLGGPEIVEGGTFRNCVSLKEVVFGKGLCVLGSKVDDFGAFEDCTSLKEVVLPEGFVVLGNGTFSGCTSLSRIVLPKSLAAIGEQSLARTAIKELIVPEGVKDFYNVAPLCPNMERIVLPSTVRSLSLKEFGGYPHLKEVVLPRRFEADQKLFFREEDIGRIQITYI